MIGTKEKCMIIFYDLSIFPKFGNFRRNGQDCPVARCFAMLIYFSFKTYIQPLPPNCYVLQFLSNFRKKMAENSAKAGKLTLLVTVFDK